MSSGSDKPRARHGDKSASSGQREERGQDVRLSIKLFGITIKAVGRMPADSPGSTAFAMLIVMAAAAIPSLVLAVLSRLFAGESAAAFTLAALSLFLVGAFGLVKLFSRR